MTHPTAAAPRFPYAHPTMAEMRQIDALPNSSPIRVRLLIDARRRARVILCDKPLHSVTPMAEAGARLSLPLRPTLAGVA